MRRTFLTLALVLALLLPVLVSPVVAQDEATVRLAWWGNEPRHEKYAELADLYEELNPGIVLEREFAGWGDYWDLLPTQVAAGNAPDILHMHPNFVAEYAMRGALLDLTPYVESGQLDLSKFPQGILDSGKVGDQIFMVTLGNSSPGIHFNPRLFEEAGVEIEDKFSWTWDEFVEIAIAIQETLPEGSWAVMDDGGSDQGLETFMRQRGKDFFIDGELGFEKEDLLDYWGIWETLREAGAIPPADVNQEYGDASHADSLLANGRVAMDLLSGNQHKLFQAQTEDELDLAVIPRSLDENGEIANGDVIGGAYLSCAASTELVDECIDFINWMVNDPDVALMYNAEHGPPGNADLAAMVAENLEPADQRLFAMMAAIADTARLRGQRAEWGGEAGEAYTRIYEELAFGNLTLEEAVDMFFEEIDFISS